jgi:BASS family bile acid:Na+ symporter
MTGSNRPGRPLPLVDVAGVFLAWLGRQGTRAVAISVFLGLAVPPLAALFKPIVPEAIFGLLVLAYLRVDPRQLRSHFADPALVAGATAWIMLIMPAAVGGGLLLLGLRDRMPDLLLALVLQGAAPPIMAAPAFAALMGLDAALSLATLVGCMALTPVTALLFAKLLAGSGSLLAPLALGARLLLILGGSAFAAAVLRRVAGARWVERQRPRIDGLNVVLLFIFAVAVMDGVAARFLTDPAFVLALVVLAFALALGQTALTTLVFARVGWDRAFVVGLACGHRNLGLMLAATGGFVPDLTWLYFGLAQFPIYLVPHLLKPAARRLVTRPDPAGRS